MSPSRAVPLSRRSALVLGMASIAGLMMLVWPLLLRQSSGGQVGPPFDHIGAQHDANYIRRSILTPNADTAKGYEKFAGTMPTTFGQQLSGAQLEALVTYLAGRK